MTNEKAPAAIAAADVPPRTKPSNYPEPYASRMARRQKRALGDFFGLNNFGVNLTRIAPGGESAPMHAHSRQDELVYVLEREAHHVLNRSDRDLVILEIGDRTEGDEGSYPQDDIQAVMGATGKWRFARKDGAAY